MKLTTVYKAFLYLTLFAVYLASTVPVGLFLYSIKNGLSVDLFATGGFHQFLACVHKSFH